MRHFSKPFFLAELELRYFSSHSKELGKVARWLEGCPKKVQLEWCQFSHGHCWRKASLGSGNSLVANREQPARDLVLLRSEQLTSESRLTCLHSQ